MDNELRAAVGRQITRSVAPPPGFKYTKFDDSPGSTHVRVVSLVPPGTRVLEFGCATGYMSEVLETRLGCAVTAIEISPEAAQIASEHCERIVVGDADELDFAAIFGSEQFDCVIFADVLEHLRKPEDVLRRVAPLVADDGAIVASIPNIAHGSVRLALLAGEFRYRELGLLDETHLRFFTREGIRDLFEENGYVITNWVRRRVDIDESEIRAPASVPAAIRDWLADDGEATTYQYIVRTVPSRASSQLGMLRGLLASRNDEIDALRPLEDIVERQRNELERLGADVERLRHAVEHERARLVAAETELEQARKTVEEEQARLVAANADAEQRWQAQLQHFDGLRQAAELEAARLREAAQTATKRLAETESELALLRQAAEHAGSLRAAADAELESVRRDAEAESEQRAALEARLAWAATREADLREMLLDANEQLVPHEVEDGLSSRDDGQAESREEELRWLREVLEERERELRWLREVLKERERELRWVREVLEEREREFAWHRDSLLEMQAGVARIESTKLWRAGRGYWKLKRLLGG